MPVCLCVCHPDVYFFSLEDNADAAQVASPRFGEIILFKLKEERRRRVFVTTMLKHSPAYLFVSPNFIRNSWCDQGFKPNRRLTYVSFFF